MPSVSFGIPRIATCRGCPDIFEGWTGCYPSVSESLELLPAAAAARGVDRVPSVSFEIPAARGVDRVPSVSFGIPRIATCCGCPEGFEGWTGCHPSISESLELQPAAAIGSPRIATSAQKVLRGGQGAIRQFRNP